MAEPVVLHPEKRYAQLRFLEDNAHNISPWTLKPLAIFTRNQELMHREFERVSKEVRR